MKRTNFVLVVLLVTMLVGFAHGQNSASTALPPLGEKALQPLMTCSSVRGLTGYDFSIETATLVSAAVDTPEYCRVRGQILPEIQFEVLLPAIWNRRFYMSGNGG